MAGLGATEKGGTTLKQWQLRWRRESCVDATTLLLLTQPLATRLLLIYTTTLQTLLLIQPLPLLHLKGPLTHSLTLALNTHSLTAGE